MDVMDKTRKFLDILGMDSTVLKDMYTKYSLLADAYAGSSGKEIIRNNKDTFQVILSSNIRDYMLYMYAGGNLSNEIASNPNLNKILDSSSSVSIEKIAKELEASGWVVGKDASVNSIKQALGLFGIQSTTDISGADLFENTENSDIPDVNFDDDTEFESYVNDDTIEVEESEESEDEDWISSEDMNDILGDDADGGFDADELNIIEEAERTANTTRAPAISDFNNDNAELIEKQIAAKDRKIDELIEAKKKEDEAKALSDALDTTEVDKSIISKTVKTIMATYDILYAHLFQETPSGILTSSGVVTVKSDNALMVMGDGNAYATRLYSSITNKYSGLIREYDYHNEISMECINPDGTLKYNYAPNFHIRNIYGIYRSEQDGTLKRETNWVKFRLKLIKSVTKTITSLLEKFKGDQLTLSMNLIELFTNVFIVEEFDVNKVLKMSIKSIPIIRQHSSCAEIGKMIASGMAFPLDTSSLEIVNNSADEMGVHNLLVVFDKKIYNGEILFAYKPMKKILESGGRLGLQQTLLGRSIKGKNVTYNFESPQAVDSLVIAGSGSGKGVVTLNMLATFMAEGCPTVYVDWKPEMAAMLWNLERSTGARILSVDGLAGNMDGVRPVRDYGTGYGTPVIAGISDKLNVIPYIKMFQTMILCARGRNMGYNGMSSKSKKMQFILDEAQAMNKQLSDVKSSIEVFMSENKPKKGEEPAKGLDYVKKLKAFIDSMFSGAVQFRNTTGRTGNVGLIMLGQQSDCTAWANGALKRDPLGFLVGNCSMKMLGKDAVDSNKYSLNGCVPAGNSSLGNMGYFALIKQAVADKSAPDKISVVKTYLVLNENDYSEDGPGKYTAGLLKNIEDDVIRSTLINEDLYPEDENGNRYVNPLVGFKGLVEYIGSTIPGFNLKNNLEAGYIEVEKLLSGLGIVGDSGKYSCIEEYIFDCSYEGLFTIDELAQLMQNNETIADLLDDSMDGLGGDDGSADGAGKFFSKDADAFSVTGDDTEEFKPGTKTPDITGEASPTSPIGRAQPQIDLESLPRNVAEAIRRKQDLDKHPENIRHEEAMPNIHYSASEQSQGEYGFTGSGENGWTDEEVYTDSLGNTDDFGNTDDTVNSGFTGRRQFSEEERQPEYMPPSDHRTFDFGGKTNRTLYITPEKTTQVLGLTKDNSVLITMPPYSTAEKFHKKLFGTLWGAQYEFKNRWRAILDGVAGSTNPDLISRIIVMEDTVVFNKKQIATINILGGDDDIRIQDIVNFRQTAKKFKNIREMMIDEVIFESAQIELGDTIPQIFKEFNQLQKLTVVTTGCGAAKVAVTRQQLVQNKLDERAREIAEKAQFKNQMETIAAAKNPNLREKSAGYQSRIWESCKGFSGQGWSSAKDAILDKNPKLFKAAGMSVLTLGVLGVGGILGALGYVGNMFRR